jgi:molybdate transport system substrate-binding protein
MLKTLMSKATTGSLCGLWVALCVLAAGCDKSSSGKPATGTLRILCGSSMAAPVQELASPFGETQNARLELDLGGSETLLPKILAGARADIFVCHDPFEQKLKAAGLWTNTVVVGYLEPVVAVRPGNPKQIRSLNDLARAGLKLGIGQPQYSTCGELFVNALRERGLYDRVLSNVVLQARSHSEIANGLVIGPLDAVVVWNFVIGLYSNKLEVVRMGVEYPPTRVTILGLASSPNSQLRDAYLDFCRQPLVRETFGRYGYRREQD